MSVLICIDPGHIKGYNRGAYAPYYEGTKMYDLGVMLKEELEKYNGIEVFLTRNSVEENPSLAQRGNMALRRGARCFLSLHSDACGTESVNRVSCFRSLTMPSSESLGLRLMNAVVDTIGKDIPFSNNTGVFTRDNGYGSDYYGVLRNSCGGSVKEAFILEHGFHTNYKNSVWLYSNDNLRKLAIAEAKVLADYYGCSAKNGSQNQTPSSNNNTSHNSSSNNSSMYIKYTVKAGDSWWKIAAEKLGSGLKMNELAAYNNSSISTILNVGDIIKIPCTNKKYKTYTVVKGDTWWKIARTQLGSGFRFKELAEYNGVSSDKVLEVGMTIRIPIE